MEIYTKKPILCFFIGYTSDFNEITNGIYGAELALKTLAELFTKTHNVFIFGACIKEVNVNNVQYFNSNILNQFMENNIVDVMIISRYIYYFLEFNIKARKTYLWVHDHLMQSPWDFKFLPSHAKYLLLNVIDKIDGVIVLSEWHKKVILDFYNIDSSKIFIFGNAINTLQYNKNVTRVKNRFIYISAPCRGLEQLVNHFDKIRQKLPDAELWIYRDEDSFNGIHDGVNICLQHLLTLIKTIPYIKLMGRIDNDKIPEQLMMADFWYYPTAFKETYCISALEALMAGCICITSDLGGLTDTIGDRGILISEPIHSEEYFNKALEQIIKIGQDEKMKEDMRINGINWAQNQTWENRVNEWYKLFN
jgi:glycosyltransferase involved in cell wall biosynthesis